MKKLLLFISIFTGLFSTAQTAAKWENVYGQGGIEYGYRVRSCLDQGYIVAGTTSSTGISDGYLVRVDSLGLVMWSKYFIGNNVDVLRSLRQLPDSGYILAGYSNSAGHGGYDGWVLRTDKDGDTLWTKYIGTTDWDFFYDVAPTYDGGFILAGGTYGLGEGDEDMYFVKIDANGDTLWTKTYGGIRADEARSVCETGDSLLAAVGFSYSLGDTLGDSWVLRMNGVGDTLWTRTVGYNTAEDISWGICDNAPGGRFYICGQFTASPGNLDPYFGAFSYAGAALFIYSSGGAQDEFFNGIVVRPNGSIAVIGANYTVGAGNGDFFMFHNRLAWESFTYGTLQTDIGYSIDIAHDDGYIACGYTEGHNSIVPNVYLIKIDTAGATSTVLSIREQPQAFSNGSISVFPNPAQEEVQIIFDSNQELEGEIIMELFDLGGRRIALPSSLIWQMSSAKSTSCRFATSHLANGAYQFFLSDNSGKKSFGKFIVAH